MAIDFTFDKDTEDARLRMRAFMDDDVRPTEERLISDASGRGDWRAELDRLRAQARALDLWMPHMPTEWGGAGLGPTALAAVSAESTRARFGSYIINCYAPDEGNMHTLLHWGTEDQKERYLKPMCEGTMRSCFAMTEPEVAGSDPTLMQTRGVFHGDEWVINGHKWFISGARGARFAILIARTEDHPEVPQAATTAFIVDVPSEGWEIVRDVETMAGSHNHCEIRITDLRVPDTNRLGGRGQGHRLGQSRLGPARLAHCMRWIGQKIGRAHV